MFRRAVFAKRGRPGGLRKVLLDVRLAALLVFLAAATVVAVRTGYERFNCYREVSRDVFRHVTGFGV